MNVETQERSGIEIKIALDIYEKHIGQREGGGGVALPKRKALFLL